jgi:two-component system phosphate regulon response regulator PhoB
VEKVNQALGPLAQTPSDCFNCLIPGDLSEPYRSLVKIHPAVLYRLLQPLFHRLFHRLFLTFCGEPPCYSSPVAENRILIVEDEPAIAEVLEYNLAKEGYDVGIEYRGDTAVESIRRNPPQLVILDLMLPGMDGLELTRLLRRDPRTSQVPLLMLTAKGEEVDRIVGLELGADDYITKPFSPREVVLRVKAVLRRGRGAEEEQAEQLEVGALRLDIAGHRLFLADNEIPLTATEFRLLKILLERRNRVQTRDSLLTDVWRYSEDVDSRTVDTHIRRLRRKLGAEADRIETVVGVGYRFRG